MRLALTRHELQWSYYKADPHRIGPVGKVYYYFFSRRYVVHGNDLMENVLRFRQKYGDL